MQKELQNMRIQYVEKERADKSNRVEIKELQIKVNILLLMYTMLSVLVISYASAGSTVFARSCFAA